MVRITEALVRKRAEHNEREIFSLEELSLHQLDVEKIEYLDKWCRDLKILYLQSNLISKIENVGRLKKLEYLNLALNNIELIENLEGCESLKKLDLTVNFIGILTSVETLKGLIHLEELFLVGNPCAEYEGYKDYVLATLPNIKRLDGVEVTRSERILAKQNLPFLSDSIQRQQEEWRRKREKERVDADDRRRRRAELLDAAGDGEIDADSEFWKEKTPYTPESRLETHEYMQEKRMREEAKKPEEPKRQRNYFAPDGRAYNVNEAKLDYTMTDQEEENLLELVVRLPKHLDLSLIDCDVQPTYVRVIVKEKVLQLSLIEEVRPDASEASRSEVTGKLYVRMPKVREYVKPEKPKPVEKVPAEPSLPRLEIGEGVSQLRIDQIVADAEAQRPATHGPLTPALLQSWKSQKAATKEKKASADFVDDPDVPPLM